MTEPTRARYPDVEDYVERDGVRVFYEVYGEGEPAILFMAPWSIVHSRTWRGQIPYFARRHRTITYDPRGNGRSDRPGDPLAYSQQEFAADALAILDRTATDAAVLVSNGPRAQAALLLAAEHPERVLAAAFIVPDLWPYEEYALRFIAPEQERYEGWEKFNINCWRSDWPGFVDWWMRHLHPDPHSTHQIELAIEYALETDGETMVNAALGPGMSDREEALALAAKIGCPVVVIQNEGGRILDIETSGPLAKATGAELVTVPGGPAPWARYPVAVNLALRRFLESIA